MTSGRKTLVFDFGNVLVNLDFKRHFESFNKIFSGNWALDDYPLSIVNAYKKYEKGLISDDDFILAFQELNRNADPNDIINAWNSLIGEIKNETLEMLESLATDYQLILLSNINNFHLLFIQRYLRIEHGISDFEERFFDRIFYSHLINLSKPDPQIYSFVEEEINVNSDDILFFDDRLENIKAASNRSWNVQLHKPEDEISHVITDYLKQHSF